MSQKTDRVIAEILQKRDRFTKNFRTENHGGAAVIYGYPVHYKEGEEKSGRKLITDWKKQKTVIRTMHPG